MEPRKYGYYVEVERAYVHSWPGQVKVKSSGKHNANRKAAFKARHK